MGLLPFGKRSAVKMWCDPTAGFGDFPCFSEAGGRIAPHFNKSKSGAIRPLLSCLFVFGKAAVGSHVELGVPKNEAEKKCPRRVFWQPENGFLGHFQKLGFESLIGNLANSYICNEKID